VKIIPIEDKVATGNFEVTILETGELIHSKKQLGMGKAESTNERFAILEKIEKSLLLDCSDE